MTAFVVETKPYDIWINDEQMGYTRNGLIVDHTTQRIRGCAVIIEENDTFAAMLRNLRAGDVVQMVFKTPEVEYSGAAQAVLIRERFSRLTMRAISFVFKLLGPVSSISAHS